MKTNIEEVRAQINEARARLANAEAELAKMEAKPKKWEPKGGGWFITASGAVAQGHDFALDRAAGSMYPTRQAVESALPYVTFYKRLCCLAQELNPSGKVGGDYYLVKNAAGKWEAGCARTGQDHTCLFETLEAANDACDILTRDGWRLPDNRNEHPLEA